MPTKKKSQKKLVISNTIKTTPKGTGHSLFSNFNREDNVHMFLGIILLIIGLWLLKGLVLGLILIIAGILFVTGYFENGKKNK